jgi:hypothetical protein
VNTETKRRWSETKGYLGAGPLAMEEADLPSDVGSRLPIKVLTSAVQVAASVKASSLGIKEPASL